jgi:XisI protein
MDKIAHYQQIICDILQEYANIKKSLTPHVKSHLIIDKENHQYQLLSIGWHNNKYVYTVAFHFNIVNGKVWIQQNNTDSLIADEIVEKGIPKSDIVLGFIPEKTRVYSGFASE